MNFIQVNFSIEPYEEYLSDLLASELGELGFDSFLPTYNGLEAFITADLYSEAKLNELLSNFVFEANIEYNAITVETINWNEEWEKHYFEPIIIDNECVIHSSFHKDIPKLKYDIVIDPKMSFGTGHHETTSLMIGEILKMEIKGLNILDMGCGTSVLAILAAMRGATKITAIDIDAWCVENSIENIALNHVERIEVAMGDAKLLKGLKFDVIIANINRNILLNDIETYADCLDIGGELYMSGFYKEDIVLIEAEANRNNLKLNYFVEKNNWVAVKTTKH